MDGDCVFVDTCLLCIGMYIEMVRTFYGKVIFKHM